MPTLGGLGKDTVPAKMLFKEPCVAEFFAAGRAEFDEVAPALQAQLRKHEEVLAQLRMRKREQFEQLGDVRIGHRCKEIDVAAGGGAVKIKINGAGQFTSLALDPEFLKEDAKLVSDTVLAAVQDRPAAEVAQMDVMGALAPFDLKSQLSSNRTQGVPNMIALVKEHAARIAS